MGRDRAILLIKIFSGSSTALRVVIICRRIEAGSFTVDLKVVCNQRWAK
jgi:hypothetical protein